MFIAPAVDFKATKGVVPAEAISKWAYNDVDVQEENGVVHKKKLKQLVRRYSTDLTSWEPCETCRAHTMGRGKADHVSEHLRKTACSTCGDHRKHQVYKMMGNPLPRELQQNELEKAIDKVWRDFDGLHRRVREAFKLRQESPDFLRRALRQDVESAPPSTMGGSASAL